MLLKLLKQMLLENNALSFHNRSKSVLVPAKLFGTVSKHFGLLSVKMQNSFLGLSKLIWMGSKSFRKDKGFDSKILFLIYTKKKNPQNPQSFKVLNDIKSGLNMSDMALKIITYYR